MSCKYYSTPIYYANDKPHVGHLYSTLLVDIWKRASMMQKKNVFFLSGLDEHGQKVAQSAQQKGCSPQEHVDNMSRIFLEFFHNFSITPDFWVRTTSQEHKQAVQAFWKKLKDNGYIYKNNYAGWYSISDEAYLQDDKEDIHSNKTNPNIVWREEECYYFKLSAFQEKLREFFEKNSDFIYPSKRYNEAVGFLSSGLKDFVISRPKARLSWGIEVPDDEEHVIYVWIDALVNYLSAIGYPDESYKKLWPATHILGKDILKFHAIYWPALLMAADIALPEKLIIHGWWLKDDAKISKSSGNASSLDEFIEKYEVDGLRYYLVRGVELGEDGQFKDELVKQVVHSELANRFGNMLLRILGIVEISFDSELPECPQYEDATILANIRKLYDAFEKIPNDITVINEYLSKFVNCAESLNDFFQKNEMWAIQDTTKKASKLTFVLDVFKKMAVLMYPVIPNTSKEILAFFGLHPTMDSYTSKVKLFQTDNPKLFPKF